MSAVDGPQGFAVGPSPCAEITPAGTCSVEPDYDPSGLTATNGGTATCGVDLAWNEATTICPAQPVVYNLYRGTDPGFTPGAANRIATGLTGTAYHDGQVLFGTVYYYRVRAEALSGVGPGPNGGVEDPNAVEVRVEVTGPRTVLFEDDVESGDGQWTVDDAQGSAGWHVSAEQPRSGVFSWHIVNPSVSGVNDDRLAIAAGVAVTAPSTELRFWHQVRLGAGDGGVLEYSTDGGATWFDVLAGDGGAVPADRGRFLAGGYDAVLAPGANPLAGRAAWAGDGGAVFEQVRVDLAGFVGQTVRLRWRFGADQTGGTSFGWYVDDVEVTEIGFCALFFDGFESGDTTAWSAAVP